VEQSQSDEQKNNKRFQGGFGLPTVLAVGALVGILGFGLGKQTGPLNLNQYASTNQELPQDLSYQSVEEVYDKLRDRYAGDLEREALINGMKSGLVNAADDPFTQYLDAEAATRLEQNLEGEFGGIGAEIGRRDGQLVIVAPLEGTPADEAGLQPQDAIVAVDGDNASEWTIQKAVKRIRGEEGSDVTLTIVRDNQSRDVTITRGQIDTPSVKSEMKEGDIGYIELTQFSQDSAQEFHRAASQLQQQGAESIIVDVRNNTGGYLEAGINITSEFLESGTVITEQRRDGEVLSTERANSGGELMGVPAVVLINGGSASASEIMAGALRDHDAATLVGQQTFGKGSVQDLAEFSDGSVLKVTIARWYTPDGSNIAEEGISPDKEVKASREEIQNGNDPQLQQALDVLSQQRE
jgi:carboxyl-terminal processing protease